MTEDQLTTESLMPKAPKKGLTSRRIDWIWMIVLIVFGGIVLPAVHSILGSPDFRRLTAFVILIGATAFAWALFRHRFRRR